MWPFTHHLEIKLQIGEFSIYTVCLVGTDDWKRAIELYDTWGKEFENRIGPFKFSSSACYPTYGDITFCLPHHSFSFKKLFYLYNRAIEDFLHNTSLKWIYRTTEDCFVNIDLLYKYLRKFTEKYDPDTYVVKGQAISLGITYFIHGGSGWIMSRKAAEKYYELIKEIEPSYSQSPEGDDAVIYQFTSRMNLTTKDIDDLHFLGASLPDSDIKALESRNFDNITKCPKEKMTYRKMKDVVFWHSGRPDNFPMKYGKEVQQIMPDNLYWVHHVEVTGLCLLDFNLSEIETL